MLFPREIFKLISDFSEAKEVVELLKTCHALQDYINLSLFSSSYVLYVPRKASSSFGLPIVSPKVCRLVFLTFSWQRDLHHRGSLYVVSCPKHENARISEIVASLKAGEDYYRSYIVLECSDENYNSECEITFRHDPHHDYFLCESSHTDLKAIYNIQVRQLLDRDIPISRTQVMNKCKALFKLESQQWFTVADRTPPFLKYDEPHVIAEWIDNMAEDAMQARMTNVQYVMESSDDNQSPIIQLLVKLFPLMVATLTEGSSPISDVFDFMRKEDEDDDSREIVSPYCDLLRFINIYEQLFEQEELEHCVVRPLYHEETGNDKRIVTLPWIPLMDNFHWHLGIHTPFVFLNTELMELNEQVDPYQEFAGTPEMYATLMQMRVDVTAPFEDAAVSRENTFELNYLPVQKKNEWNPQNGFEEKLRFVVRIPLPCNTMHLHLWGSRFNGSFGRSKFVLFVHFRTHILGIWEDYVASHYMTFGENGPFLDVSVPLEANATACFLYAIPSITTMAELTGLKVQLTIEEEISSCSLALVMERFLGAFCCNDASREKRMSQFRLLRAVVHALMECEGPSFQALSEVLEREGFDVSNEGLRYVKEYCDTLLRFPNDEMKPGDDDSWMEEG